MNKRNFSMTKRDYILIISAIILASMLTIFLGGRKGDYLTDEVWNYGLANHLNSFYPDFEYGKTYEEMSFFEDFMEVNSGERFNYINVYKNQADDVHPPFYYMILHTVCSLFPDTYSIWFAIGINMFWMAGMLFLLYKLMLNLTKNPVTAFGFILIYGSSVGLMDTLLFIRMYAQFTFFTIALAYLFESYWKKTLDKRFYRLLSVILILGTLSHYYFLIIGFLLWVMFLINLKNRNDKTVVKKFIRTSVISGIIYLVIWPIIIFHLFFGYRGHEAIQKAFAVWNVIQGAKNMFGQINIELFAGSIYVFLVIGIIAVVLRGINKNNIFRYEISLLLCGVIYTAIIGMIAPYISSRYIMPIFFIFELAAYLSTIYLLRRFIKIKHIEIAVICLFLGLNVYSLWSKDFYVPMDNNTKDYRDTVAIAKDLDAVYFLPKDATYGIFDSYGILTKSKSYQIYSMDNPETCIDDIKKYIDSNDGTYILGIYDLYGDINPKMEDLHYLYKNECAYFYLIK